MAFEQLPNKLSMEELLKAIKEAGDPPSTYTVIVPIKQQHSEILSFILAFQLKEGDYKVLRHSLFELYKKWARFPKQLRGFSKEANKYLPHNNLHFFVNLEESCLTEKILSSVKPKKLRDNEQLKQHFEYFLKHKDLKHGKHYIEAFLLFNLYEKWCIKSRSKKSLGLQVFIKFCKLYFSKEKITENQVVWFPVSQIEEKLFSNEELNQLRNSYYEKEAKKRQKERNKKKQSEISSPNKTIQS